MLGRDWKKNRIIQEKLFKLLEKTMKKRWCLYFKTDHDIYYQDMLNLVNSLENFKSYLSPQMIYSSDKAVDNIKTEFEQLFYAKHVSHQL